MCVQWMCRYVDMLGPGRRSLIDHQGVIASQAGCSSVNTDTDGDYRAQYFLYPVKLTVRRPQPGATLYRISRYSYLQTMEYITGLSDTQI